MELEKKFNRILMVFVAVALVALAGVFLTMLSRNTFAETEENPDIFVTDGERFVTFYDDGKKLTVRTEALTVGEALERAGIALNNGDKVEPGLAAEINADNFFINIYRVRPVVVKDGVNETYLMTASYDVKTIMHEAGLTVYDGDKILTVANGHFLEAGVANVYELKRNGGRTVTEEIEIAFDEETVKDYNLAPGVSEVRQLGEVGMKEVKYNVLYINNVEVSRELMSETTLREPVTRIVAVGASAIQMNPLTASKGVNIYTTTANGAMVERKETYYDLPMSGVMRACGGGTYSVREDGAKVDQDGYVLVAANLSRYPRCSVVETSLGAGKVYDTGGFAVHNPEQFDLATDWTNHDGR